jgi:hypothetical protein
VRTSLARTALVAGAVTLAVLLAGCGSQTPTPGKSTHKPITAPSATPTSTPKATDALFTIAANVRGADGSTIGILMTAHKPIAYSDASVKPYEDEFLAQCGDGKGGIPRDADFLSANGSIMVPIDITASVTGKTFVAPVGITLGSPYFGAATSGKNIVPTDNTAPCYSGYEWVTSGTEHAVADFESGTPGPDLKLWRYGLYGFGVADGSNATIEACKITITDLGKADDVASVTGWDASSPQSGLTCVIGYSGE